MCNLNIIEVIRKQMNLVCSVPASDEEISNSEYKLGLSFATEYRNYVAEFGFVSFSGHELTGICKHKRLDVVAVTTEEWYKNPLIKNTMYVIEKTNMDGIIIWQDATGAIYQSSFGAQPIKICNSLVEYILGDGMLM